MSEDRPDDFANDSDVVCGAFHEPEDSADVLACNRVSGHRGRHYDRYGGLWFDEDDSAALEAARDAS